MDAGLRINGLSNYDGGFAAGRVFAEMPAEQRPDAVFAVADIMAMGVLDAFRVAGLRVPNDISVVGFDGIAPGAWPTYSLTTVKQPLAAMVGRGLDLLNLRLDQSGLPDEVVSLRGELTIRGSARTTPL